MQLFSAVACLVVQRVAVCLGRRSDVDNDATGRHENSHDECSAGNILRKMPLILSVAFCRHTLRISSSRIISKLLQKCYD